MKQEWDDDYLKLCSMLGIPSRRLHSEFMLTLDLCNKAIVEACAIPERLIRPVPTDGK